MARFLAGVIKAVRLKTDQTASSKPFSGPFPTEGPVGFSSPATSVELRVGGNDLWSWAGGFATDIMGHRTSCS